MTAIAATTAALAADSHSYPPSLTLSEVEAAVAHAAPNHPRLFLGPDGAAALRRSAEPGSLREQLASVTVSQADALFAVDPVERIQTGRRLLGQSRRCVKRVLLLSTAYHLSGAEKYARRCVREMLAAARFSDWNPSHYLDVAEMTFALAVGYDWLYETLSPEERIEIRDAILEKGVKLPFETRHRGWVDASNNWGQVCHAGMVAGSLATLEDEPELAARTVHQALHHVTRSMHAYAPNGSYPEGPGYWSYGTTYNVFLIAMLESVFGSDFGLAAAPGFSRTGEYVDLMTGPSGEFFNYADGGAHRGPEPALHWFADRFDRPDWALLDRAVTRDRLARISPGDAASQSDRFLPAALLWLDRESRDVAIRMPLHWNGGGSVPVTVHRSSWGDSGAVFVGFKAGSPSANHGQMDIGSFVLDADGIRWALDLGAEGYHGIESRGMNLWNRKQDSDRWTIFRQSNTGHNTLVIDGQLQVAKGNAPIVAFSSLPEFPHSVADLSSVYRGQAESVVRGIALLPSRQVLIRDRLTGLVPGARVRWGMITRGKAGTLGEAELVLSQGNATLGLRIAMPEAAGWTSYETAAPRNEWDSPNRGTQMVGFEALAPASGVLDLAVVLTPGSVADGERQDVTLAPPREWR